MMDLRKEGRRPAVAESRPSNDRGTPDQHTLTQRVALNRGAIRWLAELPANVRPAKVAVGFPHIANQLALLWPDPHKCRHYFDDLVRDRRGHRKGFPQDIAFELTVLKKHLDSVVHRSRQNAWNDIIIR